MCRSILQSIYTHAQETPDKLCIGDKVRQATYMQFWMMVEKAALFLKSHGVGKGAAVAIRSCQRVEFFLALFGTQLAGGVPCPLEGTVRDTRVAEIMRQMNSSVVLSGKAVALPGVQSIRYDELYSASLATDTEKERFEFPMGEETAEILFTTGTTGISKGVEMTHLNNVALAQNVASAVGDGPDEVELITAPITHSMALRRAYSEFYRGGTVILTDGAKFLSSFFELMDRYKVTAISFAPAIMEQIMKFERERLSGYNKQLHYIQFGSAALSEDSKDKLIGLFPDVKMYNIYGSTEAGCAVFLEFSRFTGKRGCIGRTTVNTTIFFVDENRKPINATAENPGYLAFSGGMNMRGYYGEPELTAQVMDEKGNVYTSDLGYRGDDGLVYLLGRKGDVINVGGIKVAPSEVEEAAMKHPAVRDCACIPMPDEITGEAVKLFVVLSEGAALDTKDLSRFLQARLEALKVPKIYELIDAIPRTFNGKIIRQELKERG